MGGRRDGEVIELPECPDPPSLLRFPEMQELDAPNERGPVTPPIVMLRYERLDGWRGHHPSHRTYLYRLTEVERP